MKRPLVGMAIALVLGEVLANAGKAISVVGWIAISICCVILCITNIQKYKTMIVLPACIGVGVLLASQASKIPALDSYLEKDALECQVTGTVYWKEWTGEKWKLYTEENQVCISQEKTFSCRRLLLYVETVDSISIGSVIKTNGTIHTFAIATNPGQFDARQYYRAKNIDYSVFVSGNIEIVEQANNNIREWLIKIRLSLLKSLEQICLEDEFGIFQAVFLGEKTSIDAEIKSLYQANGIAHILAISGLHISFFGNLLYNFLRKLTGSYKWSMIGGIMVLVAYGWMTGFAVSALRAVIMFGCMMGAQAVGRTYDMLSATALSAILVLFEYPLQIYEAGFLLTYGAIIGIAGVMPCLEEMLEIKTTFGKSLLCSFSVQVVTLPIMLWFYYTYPIYSIVLNLLVIPFAGYLLFSAMAGSMIGMWWKIGGQFFIGSGHYVLQYYTILCHFVEKIPFATDIVGRPAFWQVCVYYSVIVFGLLIGGYYKGKKTVFVIAVLSLLLYGFLHQISDKLLHITMLDVDQGDCIDVQMPDGKHILIDGGSTGVKNVGTYRIVPYLLFQGVDSLERIVVTHPDSDHMNGICELLEDGRIQVKEILIPYIEGEEERFIELLTLAKEQDISVVYAKAGEQWDACWTCLHPETGYTSDNVNAYSVILQLNYGLFSALFTGDAGIEQEKLLSLQPVTLLKVGHHGSQYSSGEEFLSQICPKISIISCGKDNSYGHPHEEVIKRLEQVGSQIVITSEVGAIMIKTDGKRYWIERFYEKKGKYRCKH